MNYCEGQEVTVGDNVRLGDDSSSIVVYSVDTGEYSEEHPAGTWDYLKKGVMISFPQYGLIHYEKPEADLQLIARVSQQKKT
jgi:hypothetical protein